MGTYREHAVTALLAAAALVSSCDDSSPAPADFSGRYYMCFGASERVVMDIVRVGREVTFTATGAIVPISGTGRIDGRRLRLTADIPGFGLFTLEATTRDGGETFAGEARISGPGRIEATVTGQHAPWPTYDLDPANVPRFATSDAIDLSTISRVSRFRSGEGHDYSDDFESCRSMKHYYYPKDGVVRSTVRLYAPVDGTVIGTVEEYEGGTLSKGKQVGIRPDGYPAFWVIVFHVNLDSPLAVGDRVTAGQLLGTSAKADGTVTDVAFWVHTPAGDRLLSFFDCMTDSVFAIYQARGVANREAAIITRAERDADPLTCDGEQFEGPGHLPNWVELH